MAPNLLKLIVVVCTLLEIVFAQISSKEIIECYKCKSNEFKACDDTFSTRNVQIQSCRRNGFQQYGGHEYVKREFSFLEQDVTPDPMNPDTVFNPQTKRVDNTDPNQVGPADGQLNQFGNACYKVKLSGKDRDGEKIYPVVRSCFPDDPQLCDIIREIVERNNKGLLKVDFCQACYTDRCNGANSGVTLSILAFISAVLFAVITM